VYSVSNSSNVAHNTDGFDIGPPCHIGKRACDQRRRLYCAETGCELCTR
jgi:hypothetical protein